jgi:predicted enzyme related to lactoylglutathione lyase
MITVSDMNRSVEFYRDHIGLKPVTISPGWAEFELTENFNLGMHITEEDLPMPKDIGYSMGLFMYTNDLDAEVKHLKERGIKFQAERLEGDGAWIAALPDPDGYFLQIFELKKD